MAVCVVHIAAVRVGQLKLHPGQGILCHRVQLADHQGALGLVIKSERLNLTRLDLNGLWGSVQNIALQGLYLPCGNGGAWLQVSDDDAAVLVGDVFPVGGAHYRAAGIGNQEGHTLQGRGGALDILLNHEGGTGRVLEINCLSVVGIDLDGLGLMGGVNGIAGNGGRLGDHQGANHAVDLDLAVLVSLVDTVAGDIAVFVRHILAGGGGDLEGDPLQGFTSEGIPFVDDERSGLGIGDHHRLGVAALTDDHVGGCLIHDVPLGRLDLRNDISAGSQVGDADFAIRIRLKNAVLGEGTVANHPIQAHFTASRRCHTELRPGKGLAGGAVPFLDNQFALGLVLKSQADGAALLDLDGLGLGIHDETRRGLGLRHHHTFSRGQALNADLPVFVRAVDAVAVANEGAVRIGDLELGVGQCHAGIGGADFSDEQNPVRHVLKPHCYHALLSAVCQVDGLRGLDDAVPVRRGYLLQNVGARSEPRPDGSAVFPGHLLANHGAAGARGATQITQLEGGPRQSLTGDRIIFFHNHRIQRHVLEGDRPALPAMEDNGLCAGLLHLESRGGLYLRDGILAGV